MESEPTLWSGSGSATLPSFRSLNVGKWYGTGNYLKKVHYRYCCKVLGSLKLKKTWRQVGSNLKTQQALNNTFFRNQQAIHNWKRALIIYLVNFSLIMGDNFHYFNLIAFGIYNGMHRYKKSVFSLRRQGSPLQHYTWIFSP